MKIDLTKIKTFYINLDKDKERNKSMQRLVKDFGFVDATRSEGHYIKNDSLSGCATSHYNILSTNKVKLIILEDDCVIRKDIKTIEVPDDADAVYLGLSMWGYNRDVSKRENFKFSSVKDFPGIYRVDGMLATHAILYLNKDYMKACERVAKFSSENSHHIDQGFARIQRYYNVYAIGDPIFFQSSNQDATNIILRRDRIFGG